MAHPLKNLERCIREVKILVKGGVGLYNNGGVFYPLNLFEGSGGGADTAKDSSFSYVYKFSH